MSIELMVSGNEDDVLVENDGTKLVLIKDMQDVSPGTFGFSMMDEAGFTGVMVRVEDWRKMEKKVNDFIKENKDWKQEKLEF